MRRLRIAFPLLLAVVGPRLGAADIDGVTLFDGSAARARILLPDRPSTLETLAAQRVSRAAKEIWNFDLPMMSASQAGNTVSGIVLGTIENHPILAKLLEASRAKLDGLGDEGYLIRTVATGAGPNYVVLAANAPRGVFNAAVFLTDQVIQERNATVAVAGTDLIRKPAFRMRGTYNLVCWGLAPRYTREHWQKVIDTMADDGMNHILFWIAGLFRSQKYPETFIYPETPLTTQDIRQLARYANERGVDFYLGTGAFAWFGVDEMAKHHAEFREVGQPHMCRSLPASRKAMMEYLLEMHDAIPEAKGMYLEIGCEGDYHCQGPLCQRTIDDYGSLQIGIQELSFLKEFATELWRKDSQARLVWPIGYHESHKWDVKYFESIRSDFTDPRFYFLEGRQNWALQDHTGVLKPLAATSRNILHWDQYYALPLRDIGERVARIREDGLAGYTVAFEPGFNSHSIYGKRIPFPVDLMPYVLTRFAFREFTWDPPVTWSGFRQDLLNRFFGRDANTELVDLMLTLFELIRTGPIRGYYRELSKPVTDPGYGRILRPRLAQMEKKLDTIEPALGAKGRKVGLVLMRTAIADLRAAYSGGE